MSNDISCCKGYENKDCCIKCKRAFIYDTSKSERQSQILPPTFNNNNCDMFIHYRKVKETK